MPNRLVREGFLDSEAIHSLSDAAECFFHRLMLAADDAGRMDGRVEILRARLFPLDLSRRASDVEKTLAECVGNGLVIPYQWKGQRFVQITKWQRCSPCVTSKFPWSDGSYKIVYRKVDTRDGEKDFVATSMPCARDGDGIETVIPPIAGDGDGDGDGVGNEDGVVAPRKRGKQPKVSMPADFGISERVRAWAAEKGHNRLELHLESFKSKCAAHGYTYANWDDAFMEAIRSDWAKLPAAAPSAVRSGKPAGPSETPLESALAYIRYRFSVGAVNEAERDQLIAEATAKHRRTA